MDGPLLSFKGLKSDSSKNVMAELQNLSSYQLDDLPDEVLLKVLGFLDSNELRLCSQVSKRLQAISNDASLWLNLPKIKICQNINPKIIMMNLLMKTIFGK